MAGRRGAGSWAAEGAGARAHRSREGPGLGSRVRLWPLGLRPLGPCLLSLCDTVCWGENHVPCLGEIHTFYLP